MLPDVIIMGPQGSGKGTQSELLRKRLRAHVLAMGDIARELSEHNPAIKTYVSKGKLIPEKFVRSSALKVIKNSHRRLIIDGMPRIKRQALWLDNVEKESGRPLPYLIVININGREAVKRLSKRKICPQDFEPFYPKQKSYRTGICAKHNKHLIVRDDDRPQTVRYRLNLYKKRQKSILDYYQLRNRLVIIDGMGSVRQVFSRLVKVVRDIS